MKNESLIETSHEKRKLSPKKMLAIALAAGAIAVPLAGCGNKAIDASPRPTATKTEQASPEANPDAYAAKMEQYAQMDVSTFESLPRDERLAYAQYLMDETVFKKIYEAAYGKYSTNQEYKITPVPASLGNTGQEIINNRLYAEQLSYLQLQVPADTPTFDATKGREVLSAVYYDVGDSNANNIITQDYLDTIDLQGTFSRPTESSSIWTAINTSELLNGTDSNTGEKVQYKIVSYRTQDGTILYDRFVYDKFTSYDGSQKAVWLLDAQSGNQTGGLNGLKNLGSVK